VTSWVISASLRGANFVEVIVGLLLALRNVEPLASMARSSWIQIGHGLRDEQNDSGWIAVVGSGGRATQRHEMSLRRGVYFGHWQMDAKALISQPLPQCAAKYQSHASHSRKTQSGADVRPRYLSLN
jgi:hypothetical protein